MKIEHLFLSPAHNFYGHHGGPAGATPVVAAEAIECVAGRGVRGDRFFDYRPDYPGQITFFSLEVFDDLCATLGTTVRSPGAVRRNVMVRGVDLDHLIGRSFEVQGVRFLGTEECRPCHWMDEAVGPGAEAWLKGRGGLRAKILTGGILRRDGGAP
jgi:MOSC domain-containing protein YiiM